ncbi:hypothetical protein SSE37_15643 [Sagittula stellata E-37]|uniref:Uncharacterized protein n=1 Tax=Sagittula stellata (strain ATCC 700073 / DSM 11524 / E-37) TaxID=388399 RepID=A3KA80_SAGS3|nr:hypothetical protein SSE37_15643 [Sagittula stellata E-37]
MLLQDAAARQACDADLWAMKAEAGDAVAGFIEGATQGGTPIRHGWMVAEEDGRITGVAHSILLPVPPIYAGEDGMPGLLMEDCAVAPDASSGTAEALLAAAEDDLTKAGAKILLASHVLPGAWAAALEGAGYAPLTLYFRARIETGAHKVPLAGAGDIPGLVAQSAVNRDCLYSVDPFWKPHPEADARFESWMRKSLTLTDRDMLVTEAGGRVTGYAIAHPATPLHLPAAHEPKGVGMIDDYFHEGFAEVGATGVAGEALHLLQAAEGALAARGARAGMMICPADWTSKREMLEASGHEVALTWSIRR